MSGLLALITQAFGGHDASSSSITKDASSYCLYTTVLDCPIQSNDIRKAYKRRALLFHPDKNPNQPEIATLKFQAISATYEFLSDPLRKANYDATGFLPQEDYEAAAATTSSSTTAQNWKDFFQSVFHDVVTSAQEVQEQVKRYRGSERERKDVLKFYQLCKGDLDQVLTCIVSSKPSDKQRWLHTILEPAMKPGEIPRYSRNNLQKAILDDSSSSDDDDEEPVQSNRIRRKRKRMQTKLKSKTSTTTDELLDTDDEEEEGESMMAGSGKKAAKVAVSGKQQQQQQRRNQQNDSSTSKMSKRDKMELRVAKKQKNQKEKELEFANILTSKQWTDIPPHKRTNPTFSNDLLLNLERKYGSSTRNKATTTKSAKKRRK